MLLPIFLFLFFLPAISQRPLKGSQPNFARRRQMGWNRKRGVKLLKSIGVRLGQKCHFLVGSAYTKCNMAAKLGFFPKNAV